MDKWRPLRVRGRGDMGSTVDAPPAPPAEYGCGPRRRLVDRANWTSFKKMDIFESGCCTVAHHAGCECVACRPSPAGAAETAGCETTPWLRGGTGGFGLVIVGKFRFISYPASDDQCERELAVKQTNVMGKGQPYRRRAALGAVREIALLWALRGRPFVLQMVGARLAKHIPDSPEANASDIYPDIYVFLQAAHMSLRDVLFEPSAAPITITLDTVKAWVSQLLIALLSLEKAGNIIHRDLKPGNCLLFRKTEKEYEIGICDLGGARPVRPVRHAHPITSGGQVGTRTYKAPELLCDNKGTYNKAVDIWSVGCIFADLLALVSPGRTAATKVKPLFSGDDDTEIFKSILKIMGEGNGMGIGSPDGMQQAMEKIKQRNTATGAAGAAGPADAAEAAKAAEAAEAPEALQSLVKCAIHDNESDRTEALKLLRGMLTINPDERLSAEKALGKPFLSDAFLPEDVERAKRDVDEHVKNYLSKLGQLSSTDPTDPSPDDVRAKLTEVVGMVELPAPVGSIATTDTA